MTLVINFYSELWSAVTWSRFGTCDCNTLDYGLWFEVSDRCRYHSNLFLVFKSVEVAAMVRCVWLQYTMTVVHPSSPDSSWCTVPGHFVQFGSHASRTGTSRTPNSHARHTDFGQVPKTFSKVKKSIKNALFSKIFGNQYNVSWI